MRKKTVLCLVMAVMLLILSACAQAPYTGRSQLILISAQQENSLGAQAADDVLKKEPVLKSGKYVNIVNEIGARIAKASNRPDFDWKFYVVDKPKTVNAFALPGGKVFVYTGLIKTAKSREELAAVVAHEAGHIIARHGAERMSTSLLAQVGQQAAMIAIGEQSPMAMEAFKVAFGMGAQVGVILPFSREQEYEADHIGLMLMAKGGYHPEGALHFWERMSKLDKKKPSEFMSTHPSDENRIAQIQKLLPEAMNHYRPR